MNSIFKRGQLEMQFNWLFVLVIGIIILGFFLTVIKNQEKRSTVEQATELVENLDTVFTTINTNPDAVEEFDIANAEIDFSCDIEDGLLSEYYIQGAGPVDTTNDAIFTPKTLRGDRIITWTQTWKVPYEVMVFTNMINERTLFIFVEDEDGVIEGLYDEMPQVFQRRLLSPEDAQDITARGYDRYVFITTDDTFGPDASIEEHSYLRVLDPTDDLERTGTITFKDEGGAEEQMPYLTRPSIWGAFFAEDAETYNCTMTKALNRLKIVTEVLQARSEAIKNEFPAYSTCGVNFDTAAEDYKEVVLHTDRYTEANAQAIADKLEEIEQLKDIIMRDVLCPRIY